MDTKKLESLLREMITNDGAACFRSEDFLARRICAINDLAKEALTITSGGEPAPQERQLTFKEAVEMVRSEELPSDFDQWALADKDGTTVAHMAALFGTLPEGFDHWDLATAGGQTVRELAEALGCYPKKNGSPGPKM